MTFPKLSGFIYFSKTFPDLEISILKFHVFHGRMKSATSGLPTQIFRHQSHVQTHPWFLKMHFIHIGVCEITIYITIRANTSSRSRCIKIKIHQDTSSIFAGNKDVTIAKY